MKKLLLMLLFGGVCNAQITIGTPNNLTACDSDNNGVELFDLTQNNTLLIGSLDPALYTVTYHTSEVNAQAGSPMINNSDSYNGPNAMTVYARVTENQDNSNYAVASFNLIVVSIPNFNLTNSYFCTDYITQETQPAIFDTGLSTDDYNFYWTYNGDPLGTNESSLEALGFGMYEVTVASLDGGCAYTQAAMALQSGPPSPIGTGYTVNGQDVTITVEGYGDYEFWLDNGPWQESNVFTNVSLGMHNAMVRDINGCGFIQINFSIPPAPTGEPNQDFTPGDTLADLVVEGENIQWYDGIGPDSTMGTQEAPLPLTTLLVNNTTYYASQTINGEESASRLAVTVHSTMDTQEQTFTSLQYYPNPVTNTLTISNTNILDSITLYNFLGQLVLRKNSNAQTAEIDLSSLTTGIYTVKVNSAGQSKTIKIQKN